MAIQFAGGTNRNDLYSSVADGKAMIENIKTTLVAAGWTAVGMPAGINLVYTGQPVDAQTITLGGQIFTAKSTPAAPTDFQIGATADATYTNFVSVVNAQSTLFVASGPASGKVNLKTVATGPTANDVTIAKTLANTSWQYTGGALQGGGYKLTPVRTPQGLGGKIWIGYVKETDAVGLDGFFLTSANLDESLTFTGAWGHSTSFDYGGITGGVSAGFVKCRVGSVASWRIIANRYQFVAFDTTVGAGSSATRFYFCAAGVPWIPDPLKPISILSTSAGTPIVVETTTAHGMTTGQTAIVRENHVNANGQHTVTVLDSTHLQLDGTTGAAVTPGGYICHRDSRIIEFLWMTGARQSSTGSAGKMPCFRGRLDSLDSIYTVLFNNTAVSDEGSTSANFGLMFETFASSNAATANPRWHGGHYLVSDAILVSHSALDAAQRVIGAYWDMGVIRRAEALSQTGTFLSHNWLNLSDSISTPVVASVIIAIP